MFIIHTDNNTTTNTNIFSNVKLQKIAGQGGGGNAVKGNRIAGGGFFYDLFKSYTPKFFPFHVTSPKLVAAFVCERVRMCVR